MAKKRKSNMKWLILAGVLAIGAFFYYRSSTKEEPATKVLTEKVEKRSLVETVYASGKVFPAVEVEITSNISGTIVALMVKEGQQVKEGQVLAKVDPDALESMLDRAKASEEVAQAQLESAKAQKAQLEVQKTDTKRIFDRNKQLFDEGVISEADLQTSQTAYEALVANIAVLDQNIEAAKSSVKSSTATVKEQRENLSRATITAPMDGIVSKLYKKQGEQVVGTAQMAGTPILTIANLNSIEVRVDVNERDILNVAIGDTTDIELDAYPQQKFLGVVTQLANVATGLTTLQLTSDQVTNFEVRIRMLPESYAFLQQDKDVSPFRAGLSAAAEIRTNKVENVLTVPISSVTARELADSLKTGDATKDEELLEYVFVLVGGEKVLMTNISTGLQDDTYIQILKGVKVGDEIITAPYNAIAKELENGAKVKVVTEDELYKKGPKWKE